MIIKSFEFNHNNIEDTIVKLNKVIKDITFSECTFERYFNNIEFNNCWFRNCTFDLSIFKVVKFNNCYFVDSSFNNSSLYLSSFEECRFYDNVTMEYCIFYSTHFDKCFIDAKSELIFENSIVNNDKLNFTDGKPKFSEDQKWKSLKNCL